MARKPKLPKPPKRITSGFAILDVEKGRNKLLRALEHDGRYGAPIPVTITGMIVHPWGSDDGTSREFQLTVTKVEIG